MTNDQIMNVESPLGRLFSLLGKGYLHLLRLRLSHLDIDRNYFALVVIDNYNGDITQQELSQLLDTDKVSIVRVIDYLSTKGYVRRIRNSRDKRKYSLSLTEKAKLALPEIKESFSEVNKIVLRGLPDQQIPELNDSLRKIKQNITENIEIL